MFLHELSFRFQNLFDDLPMSDLGNLVDVHFRISSMLSTRCNSGWSSLSHLLCLIPCNLLDNIPAFSDCSFFKLLAEGQGLIGWRVAARPSVERRIVIWSSCVIEPLPLGFFWVRVDEPNCRGMSNVCPVVPLRQNSLCRSSHTTQTPSFIFTVALCFGWRWTSCACSRLDSWLRSWLILSEPPRRCLHQTSSSRRLAEESYHLTLGVTTAGTTMRVVSACDALVVMFRMESCRTHSCWPPQARRSSTCQTRARRWC